MRNRPAPLVALALGVGVASALLIVPRLAHSARWTQRPAPVVAMRPRIDPMVRSAALVAPVEPQTFEQLTPAQAEAANAAVPFSAAPMAPAAPFRLTGASALDRARAQTCLAMAVYYEAGSESAAGEAAVAQVVLNRVRNPLFPSTVCGVVFQGSTLATGCQFTFT
ncbi:MAG: cell wall hydrolase, partial [Caulobacteraceae bacterium]